MSELDAYYYSFEPTGNKEIDSVLQAVASAGGLFHNTDQWSESHDWINDGVSAADMIQNAANKSASNLNINAIKE